MVANGAALTGLRDSSWPPRCCRDSDQDSCLSTMSVCDVIGPGCASSFQGLSLLLLTRLFSSFSIKPFSQQAYNVQTAGTTTISGERDRAAISFLSVWRTGGQRLLPFSAAASLRGRFSEPRQWAACREQAGEELSDWLFLQGLGFIMSLRIRS